MSDGPYCSERMGPNYNAGSTYDEMYEYYGDDLFYETEHVVEVEAMIANDHLLAENARLRLENQSLRDLLEEIEGG